ncbi:MAG: hypothetical protein GXO27_03795 [Chlorobi bacterium]|nr:hypothetical protein [Chlorobiota bacterium]
MDIKKLQKAIEVLRNDLGDALVSTDIYPSGVGTPLVGYNSNPQASALFDQVTTYIKKALDGAGFPTLKDYYLLKVDGGLVVVLIFDDYQWVMFVDDSKVNLGILLNIAIPNAQKAFKEALTA